MKENAKVPVIETGVGNCHAYVDASADLRMAAEVVYNGKCSRPSVCNALETLLVHKDIAEQALPLMQSRLSEKQVELRGCERTRAILPGITPATEEDWETEYGDYILAVKVVDSLEEALAHIAKYSSGHSEVILTQDYQAAQRFFGRGGRGGGVRQRLHPVHRRRGVRPGGRRLASPPRSSTPGAPWAWGS